MGRKKNIEALTNSIMLFGRDYTADTLRRACRRVHERLLRKIKY